MNEYMLDRDVFWVVVSGGEQRVGDYSWSRHELFDPKVSAKWILRRHHVPTGVSLFFVCDFFDSEFATMTQVVSVPILISQWKRVSESTGGSHA